MSVSVRALNKEQIAKVRLYFKTLAELRGEKFLDPDDSLLKICTGTWCMIELEGGGDPVKLAKQLV